MSTNLSVEALLSNLEQRVVLHRQKEAFHAQQEVHHREQRAVHAAELERVLQNLEAFRATAAAVVEIARPLEPETAPMVEEELPPPGRLRVSRLLRRIVKSPSLKEPFSPTELGGGRHPPFRGSPARARRLADRLGRPAPDARGGRGPASHQGEGFS